MFLYLQSSEATADPPASSRKASRAGGGQGFFPCPQSFTEGVNVLYPKGVEL